MKEEIKNSGILVLASTAVIVFSWLLVVGIPASSTNQQALLLSANTEKLSRSANNPSARN